MSDFTQAGTSRNTSPPARTHVNSACYKTVALEKYPGKLIRGVLHKTASMSHSQSHQPGLAVSAMECTPFGLRTVGT